MTKPTPCAFCKHLRTTNRRNVTTESLYCAARKSGRLARRPIDGCRKWQHA